MPIYEYECSHCRFYLEVIQRISDPKLKKCPSCGRSTLQKLISAPVFRLKGSGWYETDFKSDQERKRNLAAGEKEPAAADPKEAGAKDSKEAKAGVETAEGPKPAASEPKGEAADPAKSAAKPAKPAAKPTKSAARGRSTARRPAKTARKSAAAKSSRGRGRR